MKPRTGKCASIILIALAAVVSMYCLMPEGLLSADEVSASGDTRTSGDEYTLSDGSPFYLDVVIDNSTPLDEALTAEYDLDELSSFFYRHNLNESGIFGWTVTYMTYEEVNAKYPVEIVRSCSTNYYSVYKVKQGGYFYVFWYWLNPILGSKLPEEYRIAWTKDPPTIWAYSYLPNSLSLVDAVMLKLRGGTAADVREFDPFFELDFVSNASPRSFSVLDEDTFIEVRYEDSDEKPLEEFGYEGLLITEIKLTPIDRASTYFSNTYKQDFPDF